VQVRLEFFIFGSLATFVMFSKVVLGNGWLNVMFLAFKYCENGDDLEGWDFSR
jgi:hypothetical protein